MPVTEKGSVSCSDRKPDIQLREKMAALPSFVHFLFVKEDLSKCG